MVPTLVYAKGIGVIASGDISEMMVNTYGTGIAI